ncbi:Interleukin-4 receptor subunit alpha, partial [Galemys pyrenaicus]
FLTCAGVCAPLAGVTLGAQGSRVSPGSMKVLHEPTCLSDYINISSCEWSMDGPINCSAELRLSYRITFPNYDNYTCVPENKEDATCMCYMPMDVIFAADTYLLSLWAGRRLLWSGSFTPSDHVKPLAPGNLTVHANGSDMWLLRWTNPYPRENHLYSELTYEVNVSNDNDPADVRLLKVLYKECILQIAASTLRHGAFYSARVKTVARGYNSSWSDWSPSARWQNHFKPPLEQRLPLDIGIACLVIAVLCVCCYFGITKIKKEWWDQIPNPARSPLVAIVIQDSQVGLGHRGAWLPTSGDRTQRLGLLGGSLARGIAASVAPRVSLWGKRPGGKETAKCPHWKTCLAKLLPCFLEHGMEKDEDTFKAARNGPFQGPGIPSWCPVEVSKTVLWPESTSVVRCVELLEAPEASEEEEEVEAEEDDKGHFSPSPENSRGSFLGGREGIAARLTENLFLDLLGDVDGDFYPQGLEGSGLPLPAGSRSAPMPWMGFPREGPQETCQSEGPESDLWATWSQSPARLTVMEMPTVITDNPAYRSLSAFPSQPSGPGAPDTDPEPAGCRGEVDPGTPCAHHSSGSLPSLRPEPQTWEQVLRQSVLQHRTGTAPAPLSDYRAVEQGGTQDAQETGYKAFSSLLSSSATRPEESGVEGSSGDSGYRPLKSLLAGCPEASAPVSVPLFTFGLDLEPPGPQHSLPPGSPPECTRLEPAEKGEHSQKPPCAPEQAADPLREDLGSGIIYSALTCHLCGHLKQCHGQEERADAHVVAAPCCGCCCGDRCSPPLSPLRALDSLAGGLPLEAGLSSASLAPLGVSAEGKPSPLCQAAPGRAPSSAKPPKTVGVLARPACMTTS